MQPDIAIVSNLLVGFLLVGACVSGCRVGVSCATGVHFGRGRKPVVGGLGLLEIEDDEGRDDLGAARRMSGPDIKEREQARIAGHQRARVSEK
eukprot:492146-Rhodomonas_salina.2